MNRAIPLLLLASVTLGCSAGRDYRRPATDLPATWRFEEKNTQQTANTVWWEQFGDPVLNKLIAAALRENKDVKTAAARVEEFMGRYISGRSALSPQVRGGALAERERTSERGQFPLPSSVKNPVYLFETFLSANWELDFWGRLRWATEAARADLLATEENRRAVVLPGKG